MEPSTKREVLIRNIRLRRNTIRFRIHDIRSLRDRKTSCVLVTGANGFLGSHLAMELLCRGHEVVWLTRACRHSAAQERVAGLLDWFARNGWNRSRLHIMEGDLDHPDLGMDEHQKTWLVRRVSEIIHCASNTSFSERHRRAVEKANVANLKNLLLLAAASRCGFFHLVSTAFVAGARTGCCREELIETQHFTNVYEETKYLAETITAKACSEAGIPLNIYRPSIVYGDSRSGRTIRFNAIYYPVRTIHFLKNLYKKDILEHGGLKARDMGIRMRSDGRVHLPIRIEAVHTGGINLIPIDYFVEAFMAIMDNYSTGGIFHIVNPALKPVEHLIDYTQRFLEISGMRTVSHDFLEKPCSGLELLVRQYFQAYQPYMNDRRIFDQGQTGVFLDGLGIRCPDFNYEIFSRCMRYAVETDWGKKFAF